MSTQVVVYTMKGCPYCVELKELLVKENIEFGAAILKIDSVAIAFVNSCQT